MYFWHLYQFKQCRTFELYCPPLAISGNGALMLRVFPYGALQFVCYEQYKNVSSHHNFSYLVAVVLVGEDFPCNPHLRS